MSDEYEDMFDDDELEDLYEGSDMITPEEAFKMVMINRLKGTKVYCQLQDSDGDNIDLSEVVEQLLAYVKDQMDQSEEGNEFTDQIMPLMSQAMISGLGRTIGIPMTAFHMSNEVTRMAFIHMMAVSFLLLKWLQQKKITIETVEEEVTEEEIDELERKSKANDAATLGTLLGGSPQEILQGLMENGQITKEDMSDLLGGDHDKTNRS